MSDTLTGGCLCGAIRYEVSGPPDFSFICQCRRCQRITGTGHAPAFKVDRDRIAIKGTPKSYESPADSGATVTSHFCGSCGAPLFSATSRFP